MPETTAPSAVSHDLAETAPQVTIAIVTRNRKDELRRALRSALEQQDVAIEVLVIDDGSSDGTADMVATEFPAVRLASRANPAERRPAWSNDVAAARNEAAELARAPIILSIDDDAEFSSPRTVADTLAEFDDPRIGGVAIPYIDVGLSDRVQQRAPGPDGEWVTTIFRATAYAIRREAHLQIGGFTPQIGQFGEEWDLSLKLVDAGYLIRFGHAEPIHHHTSPKRDVRRMDILYRRNEWLIPWMYFPSPWHLVYPLWYSARGLRAGIGYHRPANMLWGIASGIWALLTHRPARTPIARSAFELDQWARSRVRAGRPLTLAEAGGRLSGGPLLVKPQAGGWPAPAQRWYGPSRNARLRLTRLLGRPVRCEVCGDTLFRGIPLVYAGRLKLLGAETARVRADWDKMNRLSFRHIDSDHCTGRR